METKTAPKTLSSPKALPATNGVGLGHDCETGTADSRPLELKSQGTAASDLVEQVDKAVVGAKRVFWQLFGEAAARTRYLLGSLGLAA